MSFNSHPRTEQQADDRRTWIMVAIICGFGAFVNIGAVILMVAK